MGFFDMFNGRKRKKALMDIVLPHEVESRTRAVDTDEIPSGYGPFGLCKTNPIPIESIFKADEYLSKLRTNDRRKVEASRLGSTSAPDVTSGMIDIYRISVDGTERAIIYVCPYHNRNSTRAPDGFFLA